MSRKPSRPARAAAPDGDAPPDPADDTDETDDEAPLDEAPVPGGLYIRGGRPGKGGKHYGGEVINAHGEVLKTFKDREVVDIDAVREQVEGE